MIFNSNNVCIKEMCHEDETNEDTFSGLVFVVFGGFGRQCPAG
jgi:hypothetical protein